MDEPRIHLPARSFADGEIGRSSVKVTTNAKGEAQVETKVYSDDADTATLAALSAAAVETHVATRRALAANDVVLA